MLALIIIIIIDLLVVVALFYYGTRGSEEHEVSLTSPAIKAMSGSVAEAHAPGEPEATPEKTSENG